MIKAKERETKKRDNKGVEMYCVHLVETMVRSGNGKEGHERVIGCKKRDCVTGIVLVKIQHSNRGREREEEREGVESHG